MSYTGRDWPDLPEEVIALDPDTYTFETRGDYQQRREQARAEAAVEDIPQIVAALENGPVIKSKLRDYLGWDGTRFNSAVAAAIESGIVTE